ncbi:ArsR family transcriptional regulator [Actibacterium mucosum KCTC 23349]|uniref:ArsR family transcriptional regulator n=1 Tax=Actibacterium mucosum KCTC 23349 TaxID=1454373 RepID=A0A037ZLC3_9RHOB|nr:metalloregulator ArsR/SmtB family transcription factor [Actibacterium mucosum]KAJ56404.1 ArsR family transcriptional regulator [Actibacterium mucosum KCTC 23349]
MDDAGALKAFAALAGADRLAIVKLLVEAGPDGLNAGEIARLLGAAPSRASFHLSTLAETGMVSATKQARTVTYRIDFAVMAGLVQFLMEDCCKGAPQVRDCCG